MLQLHAALLCLGAVLVPVAAVTEVASVVYLSNNSCLGRPHDSHPQEQPLGCPNVKQCTGNGGSSCTQTWVSRGRMLSRSYASLMTRLPLLWQLVLADMAITSTATLRKKGANKTCGSVGGLPMQQTQPQVSGCPAQMQLRPVQLQ